MWAEKQGFAVNKEAVAGREGLRLADVYDLPHVSRRGQRRTSARPDLSSIGKGQNAAFFQDYIPNAATKYGNKAMAVFAGLPEDQVEAIAAFLAASKGPK